MAKKSIEYDIVEVVWIDAEEQGDVGWNDLKEQLRYAKKPCPTMTTVGYLVYDGKEHISLLSTIGDKECSTLEKIPKGFVVSMTILRKEPKREGTNKEI
tara:strand:- start:22 stop:318 length:297 start_codon:yes stop_codon:yes gene_type:complete